MSGGLILAGGRSKRFGSEKAVAQLGGQSLLARAHGRLLGRCSIVAVSAPARSGAAALAPSLGATVLSDPLGAPRGPLAGVLSGLNWLQGLGGDLLVTLPCDTPLAPADLVERLLDAIGGADAAVARTPGGSHWLCAVWRTTLIAPLTAAIADGSHPPVRGLLTQAGAMMVDFAEDQAFANINAPEDLAAIELALSRP